MLCLRPRQQQTVNHEINALYVTSSICLLNTVSASKATPVKDKKDALHVWSAGSICLLALCLHLMQQQQSAYAWLEQNVSQSVEQCTHVAWKQPLLLSTRHTNKQASHATM